MALAADISPQIWLKPIGNIRTLNSAKAPCEFQTIPPAKAGGNLKETAFSDSLEL
jgi:hypothetical protein